MELFDKQKKGYEMNILFFLTNKADVFYMFEDDTVGEGLEKMKDRGFIIGKNGIGRNVLAFQPPLVINEQNIKDMINALDEVLSELN